MKIKELNLTIEISLLVILMSSFALAFAVSIPSLPQDEEGNRILYMMPGQETAMTFVVQNGGGATEEIIVRADLIEGSEVIRITDAKNTYNIPAGGRVDVNTIVTLPSTAQIGDTYNVILAFGTAPEGGGIALGSSIQQKFKVVVKEKVEKEKIPFPTSVGSAEPEETKGSNKTLIISLIAAIILIIIIIILIRKKKNY